MGKRGSVWMNPDTFYLMLTDICLCLKEQGFKRIGIIQTHGGIFVMTPLVRELNATNAPDLMVARVSTGDYSAACREAGIVESKHEIHAGEKETSLMLYLRPELGIWIRHLILYLTYRGNTLITVNFPLLS
jgi:creatinine amidohydrolase